MGKVVEFNTNVRRLNTQESIDQVDRGKDFVSDGWIPDTVLIALARSYIVKAAQLTRRVRGADDSLAWMLEDMADILTRGDLNPRDPEVNQAHS